MVPKIKAIKPSRTMTIFFKALQYKGPKPSPQFVKVSMYTGTSSPNIEQAVAPMSEMNGPILGTAIARETGNIIGLNYFINHLKTYTTTLADKYN